jgi:hypothetical protein
LNPPENNARPIRWLMLALLAWGCLLAVGTFLYRINQAGGTAEAGNLPFYRGLIVLACTLGFLGLWALALAFRKRRPLNGERGA